MALTADRNTRSKNLGVQSYIVASGSTIYKGAMVCLNASGLLVPAADTNGFSNVVGVAEEQVVGNGTLECRVVFGRSFKFAATSITQAMVGSTMYAVDDQTVDDSAGVSNGIRAGTLVRFESTTEGWVLIDQPLTTPATIGTSDLDAGAVTAPKLSATLIKGHHALDITTARIIATNAVQNTTEGGVPDGNTAPILARVNGATDKALRLTWAASAVNEIQFAPFALPGDLDEDSDVTVHLLVAKDANNDATAAIDVQVFNNVGDTEMGGATAAITETDPTEKVVTVLAANVAAHPGVLNIALVPGAHDNDAIYLYGAWVEYTRK